MHIKKVCWLILAGCLIVVMGCAQRDDKDASLEYLLTVQIDGNADPIKYYDAKNKELLYQEVRESGIFASVSRVDITLSHKVDVYPHLSLFVTNNYPSNQVKITFIGYETAIPDMERRISLSIYSPEALSGLLHMFVENKKQFLLVARTWDNVNY